MVYIYIYIYYINPNLVQKLVEQLDSERIDPIRSAALAEPDGASDSNYFYKTYN